MRDESRSPNFAQTADENEDVVLQMKRLFLADRTEESAVETLEKLLSMEPQKIDMDTWVEVKDLLSCLVETITVTNLVSRHQIIVLNAINSCPSIIVGFLADLIARSIDQLEKEMATSHVAIPIAFARRISDAQCSDSIAKFLWRFAHIEAVRNELKSLLVDADAEVRFRVHQVTSNFLREKGSGSEVSELLDCLIEEINVPDVLTQLTAIEVLSEAAYNNKAATAYLYSLGLIDRMYQLLNSVSEHPDAGFLFPGVMKFFGHLSVTDIHCLLRFPNFLRNLFDLVCQFDRLDASLRLLAFDTFAVVASTEESKLFLSTLAGYDIEKALNMFAVAIATGPLELRTRHLEALSLFFQNDENIVNDALNVITKTWWGYLGDGFPVVLVMYLSRPFEQLRIATLQLITTIFCYDWAVEVLKSANGFLEALLDRRSETSSQGKELKFNIVCLLIDKGGQTFPPEVLMRLKLYRREGAFFVGVEPQVDMLSN